ncbi:MAG: amidohydrolase family protein [Firmicutes bacterium]|nr:amidohydrolase family protein [Bacillota bacterium]
MSDLKYIVCGKFYDGIHDELREGMKILVDGKRIAEIGPKLERPESAELIDLSDATVAPGMIDAHTHMDYFDWHTIREEVYMSSEEMKALAIARCAEKALRRGFTSVRHMGSIASHGYGVHDVKRAIDAGLYKGARIKAAALSLCSPGSHGDQSQGIYRNYELSGVLQHMKPVLGSGKDFFINAVREEIKYGADFIKIMATGGFFTPNDTPLQKQLNDEELKAIIDTAHELGSTATAHVYSPEMMKSMLNMGIDGMEHGSLMDDETAELYEKKGAYLVPTFCPYDEAVHYDPEKLKDKQPEFRAKLELYKDALIAGREAIRRSNIMLGYGTDFVANHQNYDSGWEYAAWMKSGMGGFRALKAATSTNAKILHIEHETGTLEKGKLADISGWKRDLLSDPAALLDCAFVMKEGVSYETEISEDIDQI